MTTTQWLNNIGGTNALKSLLRISGDLPVYPVDEVRTAYERILYSVSAKHEPREFEGFWSVDPINRIVRGLEPSTYTELTLVLFYLTTLIFNNPSIRKSWWWIINTCYSYGIEAHILVVMRDFQVGLSSFPSEIAFNVE